MRLWERFKDACGYVPEFARPPPLAERNDWRTQRQTADVRSKARATAITLLKAGRIDAFNKAMARARKADPAFRLDLSWAPLDRCDLRGADLRDVIFTMASLTRADLRGVDFDGADLRQAGIDGALADGADFSKANIGACALRGAFLGGALPSRDQLVTLFGGGAMIGTLQRARFALMQFRKEFPDLAPPFD